MDVAAIVAATFFYALCDHQNPTFYQVIAERYDLI
jgi:hypothetical protein